MEGQGFTVAKIAILFNVDVRNLRYQITKNNIPTSVSNPISERDLDERVAGIVEKFPNAGNKS